MLKQITQNETIAKRALKEIKNYIVQANLKPGDKLPSEAEICRQLGCSKSSVREALRSLEALGIIRMVQGVGTIVSRFNFDVIFENLPYHLQVSKQNLQELFEIRAAFEVYFLNKAIETIDAQKVSQLEQLVETMEKKTKKGESFSQEDFMFHSLLFESLHNTAALELMRTFWNFLSRSRYVPLDSTQPLATARGHRKIVNALKRRNVVEAQKAMEEHFSEIRRRLENDDKV